VDEAPGGCLELLYQVALGGGLLAALTLIIFS
jgi:hypothetical protein